MKINNINNNNYISYKGNSNLIKKKKSIKKKKYDVIDFNKK